MTNITRLFDFPYYQLENNKLENALVSKVDGNWIETSTEEYLYQSLALSKALINLGVKKNDKIAVISSSNRTEWNITDIGILQVGAQNIPIYPTIAAEDYKYILNHSEAIFCFVSDKEVFDKVSKIKTETNLIEIYSFDKIEGCKHISEIINIGKTLDNESIVEERKSNVSENDLATIIYTSGTTGKPKGVMLTHKNITSNVLSSSKRVPTLNKNGRILSFLPLCHIFERVLIYVYQYIGAPIYYAESLETIGDNIKEVKPELMSVVPRLLEKVYDKIINKGKELKGIKKSLFFWAVSVGEKWEPYSGNGFIYELKLKIAYKLILSKWKEALGGNLITIVSGSAPLQPRLAKIFGAAQMKVMEGYGLTETSPVVTVGEYKSNNYKLKTVGKAIEGVEIKIAEDGEILVKGPNVMLGYYKDEEKTNKTIENGYFHTGDKGAIDEEGFLSITGRKKEMFKTSGGKYIIPNLIENELKHSQFIEQIMVIGEGEKMPAAIIQPNFDFIRNWIKIKKHSIGTSHIDICNSSIIIKRIQIDIDYYNNKFGSWEKVKKFELTPEIWSIDNELLTPTMKVKREFVKERYKNLYENIYS